LLGAIAAVLLFAGMAVDSGGPAVAAGTIAPTTLSTAPAHVGSPYAAQLTFGGVSTWSVAKGTLPPGLKLISGVITGVPTQPGAYTFAVKAVSGSSVATKGYTIFVRPPASGGFDDRVDTELQLRAVGSPPGCKRTGDLSNAIATIQLGQEVADANARLASIRIDQIGGRPPACGSHDDPSTNNLMLSMLIRPYELYSSGSNVFPGLLTTAAEHNLVLQMWNFARPYSKIVDAGSPWRFRDSENHIAQANSFNFLAAQIFKNRPDYRNRKYADGSTVAKQYQAWHGYWMHYFDEKAKRGMFIEAGSPGYHGYTLDAILNIYNFAEDPVLRQKAGMILDIDFADFAQQELQHVWGGGRSRSYPSDSYNGADDDMTLLADLLYGPTISKGDNHALMLASSGYYPPPVVTSMITDRAHMGAYAYVARRPGVGTGKPDEKGLYGVFQNASVLTYTYSTPQYVLGTAELQPGVKYVGSSKQNRWQGFIFNTTAGDRIYPQAGPPTLRSVNDAFLSVQRRNVLITAKSPLIDQPTYVYFPNTLDSVTAKRGWLFVKEGRAYAAVKAVGGYQWLTAAKNKAKDRDQRYIRLRSKAAPIVFEGGTTSTYKTLAAFQAKVLKNKLVYKNGTATYISGSSRFSFFGNGAKAPQVNGSGPGYSTPLVFNSPFMKSRFGSGKITIKKGKYSATYDFTKYAAPRRILK
jgi:hypothetical protein